MSYILDRRQNSKNKSMVNRQRFLDRYKGHIKKSVQQAVDKRSITDIHNGETISIPTKDISEPQFHHGNGGVRSKVLPGNKDFVPGDKIQRPDGGASGGGGQGKASNQGEGDDDFAFHLTQEEFLNFIFEDLALPNLIKRQLLGSTEFKYHRAGIANEGNPGKVNIVRSLRAANARRLALTGSKRRQLKVLEAQLQALRQAPVPSQSDIQALENTIAQLRARIKRVPWLDSFDLKYNLHVKHPVPSAKAVMFCIMDVSGSMDQATKDIAKRFFLLLYLFLQRNYEHTEVVFIRHHTSAKEVNEQDFFYSRETGGTIVSSALKLMDDIMKSRFNSGEWNIYAAQASDGDNWNDDSAICQKILSEQIMPQLQHYAYIEITPREHQSLWFAYESLQAQFPHTFALRHIQTLGDIFPVFRNLFQKKAA